MANLFTTIEADIENAWGVLEAEAETEALVIWTDFKVIFTAALPGQMVILKNLVTLALQDITDGNVGDVVSAVLNLAETQEQAWVAQLESNLLQALVAIFMSALQTDISTT